MAGEWRRASQAYGVSYSVHPFGMLAPVPSSKSFDDPAAEGVPDLAHVTEDQSQGSLTPDATTGDHRRRRRHAHHRALVVRLLLSIRRTRRE
jgi:hypothetical protein